MPSPGGHHMGCEVSSISRVCGLYKHRPGLQDRATIWGMSPSLLAFSSSLFLRTVCFSNLPQQVSDRPFISESSRIEEQVREMEMGEQLGNCGLLQLRWADTIYLMWSFSLQRLTLHSSSATVETLSCGHLSEAVEVSLRSNGSPASVRRPGF